MCRLTVRSRAFSAEQDFYFDRSGVEAFVASLTVMDNDLKGKAELRTPYEDDRINFEVTSTGSVFVSGALHEHSEHSQRLQFAFRTDQTCLSSFVQQFTHVLNMLSGRGHS